MTHQLQATQESLTPCGQLLGILVAGHEERHHQVCKRMHHMSIKEKPTKQTQTTYIPHLIRYVLHPIHLHSYGLHCQTTDLRIL